MIFDTNILIQRDSGGEARDSVTGTITGEKRVAPVYKGRARVASNVQLKARPSFGGEMDISDATVFLPPGDWGIRDKDIVIHGNFRGRVRPNTHDTQRFYTRMEVDWDATPL